MHISTQHLFMKQVLNMANVDNGGVGEDGNELSREFLRVLYHRWVLRTFQCHNSFAKTSRLVN